MIRAFRISECPSCEGGKNGLVQWDPETGQVIINNVEQPGEWEKDEADPLIERFHGTCGAPVEDEGEETVWCSEPICLEVIKNEAGEVISVDVECFHDDSVFVEYFELIDGKEVKLSDSNSESHQLRPLMIVGEMPEGN